MASTYVVFGNVDQKFTFEEHLKGEALVLQFVDQLKEPILLIRKAVTGVGKAYITRSWC